MDTNVVSELLKEDPAREVLRWMKEQKNQSNKTYVSAPSKAEIEYGIYCMPDGKIKRLLIDNVKSFFTAQKKRCYAFNARSAIYYAQIGSENKKAGRNIGEIDTMIAAVAVQHKLILATRNVKHFAGIENLKIINPWDSQKRGKISS